MQVKTSLNLLQRPELHNLGVENLIKELGRHGIVRLKHETLGMMFKKSSEIGIPVELLQKLILAYYEARFAQNLTEEQKNTLKSLSLDVEKLISKNNSIFSKFRPG